MTTEQSSQSIDVTTCRKCGVVFSRALSACPECGVARRRRKQKRRSLIERWQLRQEQVTDFIRLKKYYFIYTFLGVFAGVLLRPGVMFLAEFSMPEGWRNNREQGMDRFSVWHVIGPFFAAARTLWRWLVQSVVGITTWIYETIADLIVTYPSAVVMGVTGAAIGFWMARRRHNKHRSRRP